MQVASTQKRRFKVDNAKDVISASVKKRKENDTNSIPVDQELILAGSLKTVGSFCSKYKEDLNNIESKVALYNFVKIFIDQWTTNLITTHEFNKDSTVFLDYISAILQRVFRSFIQENDKFNGGYYEFLIKTMTGNDFILFMRNMTMHDLKKGDVRQKCSCGFSYAITDFEKRCQCFNPSTGDCTCKHNVCIGCMAVSFIRSAANFMRETVAQYGPSCHSFESIFTIKNSVSTSYGNRCAIICNAPECKGAFCIFHASSMPSVIATMKEHIKMLLVSTEKHASESTDITTLPNEDGVVGLEKTIDIPNGFDIVLATGQAHTNQQIQFYGSDALNAFEKNYLDIQTYNKDLLVYCARLEEMLKAEQDKNQAKEQQLAETTLTLQASRQCVSVVEQMANASIENTRRVCEMMDNTNNNESELTKCIARLYENTRHVENIPAYTIRPGQVFPNDPYLFLNNNNNNNTAPIEVQNQEAQSKDIRKCSICRVTGHNMRNKLGSNPCPIRKLLEDDGRYEEAMELKKSNPTAFKLLIDTYKNRRSEESPYEFQFV
jgi:hypothetical protein